MDVYGCITDTYGCIQVYKDVYRFKMDTYRCITKPAMPLDPHTQVMQTRSTRSFCPEGLPSTLFVGSCAGQQSVSSQQTTPAQEKPVSIKVKNLKIRERRPPLLKKSL